VNSQQLLILVGLFYIFLMGIMSLLRREGLSGQFALESLLIIALAALVEWALGVTVAPITLFILLYLFTMRARLLADLANLLYQRRGYAAAARCYRLALRLFPDRTSRFIVLVNWGIAHLHAGDLKSAITTLKGVLDAVGEGGGLGLKHQSACHYNLGLAYRKTGDEAAAAQQFDQVVALFPTSVYAQAAERALQHRRERGLPGKEN
jgi:tetratricopeptide (TPR) repeat protein